MRLKKLTISGFKSFADKVALDFDYEIVGIVGPNGCGKSNIVDAFRWVMGEQSAKSLRGDKMHDVLFAGADGRKPLNFAEVAVTLTDIQGELPLPYDEITIARRLYRSGESEYYINREPTRLKDIQSLLLGSGIGKNAFSIFEQGKLDQIIHLSPNDRRAIFDEAAGTSRFLLRKKETVRKLVGVTENFTRVHDVHAEIEKQAKQLKRQASHAKTFQDNKTRLEELEKGVLLYRWSVLAEKNSTLESELSLFNQKMALQNNEVAQIEEQLQQNRSRQLEEEIAAKELQKQLNLSDTKAKVLEAEISQQKHYLLEAKKRESTLKSHQAESVGQQQQTQELITLKETALKEHNSKKESLEKKLKESKERAQKFEIEVTLLREALKKLQAEHLHKVQETNRQQSKLQETVFRYETHLSRLNALVELENKGEENAALLAKQAEKQREKIGSLTTLIDAFKGDLEKEEKELQNIRKQIAEMQKEESSLNRKMNEMEGHQKALLRLKEELEGFSDGAKLLLKESKNPKSPLYQKIESLIDYFIPKKGFESLLAVSMRHYVETLVVNSEADFHLLLDFAHKKKISGFSLLIKERIKTQAGKKALAHLESSPIAYHFSQDLTINEQGNFFDALGVYFQLGGKQQNNAFMRHAEILSIAEQLETLKNTLSGFSEIQQQENEKLKSCEKRRLELAEARRKKEMDLIQENFILQQALKELESHKKESAQRAKEKEDLLGTQIEPSVIEALKNQYTLLVEESKTLSDLSRDKGVLLESQQNEYAQALSELKEVDLHFHSAKEMWFHTQQEIEVLKAKHQQRDLHEKKMAQEIVDLRASVEATLKNIAHQEGEHLSQIHANTSIQMKLKTQEKMVSELKKVCEQLDKEIAQKRKLSTQVDKEKHSLELVLAKELSEKNAIETELQERYALQLNEWNLQDNPVEVPFGLNLEEASHEMHRLRAALEDAGAVNMTAIDEFQQCQDRFDFLDKQLKDLEEAKKDLEEIIAKLDQESRKIFKKTFQQIRENFQKNFSILFNGGSADLTFTESPDILEAGIEINAKPPGKQMRSISLLSGGEKCLTALALLFSIFEVRPAPFCILDEVDAPLDDSNIDRFTCVLKQFIDKTQFIIVTHNKKTMAIADLLVGVSMEEKGVSKLISLELCQQTL